MIIIGYCIPLIYQLILNGTIGSEVEISQANIVLVLVTSVGFLILGYVMVMVPSQKEIADELIKKLREEGVIPPKEQE